ncbi:MAG: guanine deaminase [Candidatus Cloacimonetes bacterium]|nr:guanine deaminase [Candidatus Cloacimonadota bacterium]
MKIIKTNIMNPVSPQKSEFHKDIFITLDKSKITAISKQNFNTVFDDYSNFLCLPGFIDTHVHLSQFNVTGRHSTDLLKWLNKYIFAEEYKSKDEIYARKIAHNFFSASLKSGTTTSVIYTAPFRKACDIAFETAKEIGVRAMIGKTMMDCNSPKFLQENTEKSFSESVELFEKWNLKTPLLEYIFSPRFAPVCSSDLLKKVGDFANKNNAFIQTHLSENKNEIDWVKKLFPKCSSYTEVYEKHNILGSKTILGHAIHLVDEEFEILKNTDSKIAHCPDSNFFLKSGIFPMEKMKEKKIDFALASDVAAGTSLSMFNVMKMCIYRQDDYKVFPEEAFYYATLAGAKILGKENVIGSLEVGKEADLIFMEIPGILEKDKSELLAELVYLGNKMEVKRVFVAGKEIFKKDSL